MTPSWVSSRHPRRTKRFELSPPSWTRRTRTKRWSGRFAGHLGVARAWVARRRARDSDGRRSRTTRGPTRARELHIPTVPHPSPFPPRGKRLSTRRFQGPQHLSPETRIGWRTTCSHGSLPTKPRRPGCRRVRCVTVVCPLATHRTQPASHPRPGIPTSCSTALSAHCASKASNHEEAISNSARPLDPSPSPPTQYRVASQTTTRGGTTPRAARPRGTPPGGRTPSP
mmetsp:Transcript_528/g.2057  ORF Transcript_528/g.2057 Transcript_528/m.2057 type:complete len:227 (-) Transcript_528:18-698(-)